MRAYPWSLSACPLAPDGGGAAGVARAAVDGGGSAVEITVVVTFWPAMVRCTVWVTTDGWGAAACGFAVLLPSSRVRKYAASAPPIAPSASSATSAGHALRRRPARCGGYGAYGGGAIRTASSRRSSRRVAAVGAARPTSGNSRVEPAASDSAPRSAATNSAQLS